MVVVPFLATALAITLLWTHAVRWPDLTLLGVLYALVGFGVTVGSHRLLTHRSLRPHLVVKGRLILGSMAVEGRFALPMERIRQRAPRWCRMKLISSYPALKEHHGQNCRSEAHWNPCWMSHSSQVLLEWLGSVPTDEGAK